MENTNIPFYAYKGDLPYVFISYAHKDSERVFQVIEKLHNIGYPVWYDEGIDPGNEWPEEISNALKGCSLFLVFLSANSVQSRNVRNEINLALNKNLPFLSVYLEETELIGGLDLQIGSLQAIMKHRMNDDSFYYKLTATFGKMGFEVSEENGAPKPTPLARPAANEQTAFNVELTNFGKEKIWVIKIIRDITALSLREVKELVDTAPKFVKEGIPKEEAEAIKAKLEAAGAVVTLKEGVFKDNELFQGKITMPGGTVEERENGKPKGLLNAFKKLIK